MSVLDRMPWAAKDSVFQRLAKIAEVRNLTKEERAQYDASLKKYRDTINVMRGQREEGLREGLQQGLQQGLQRGVRQANLKNAKTMKDLGIDILSIQKVTGLSVKEIEAL